MMKNILIIGGTGFIGSSLVNNLSKDEKLSITIASRGNNYSSKKIESYDLGQKKHLKIDIFNSSNVNELVSHYDIIVNFVGILFEKRNNTFESVHHFFPKILAAACKKHNKNLIHISSLGSDINSNSRYLKSKALGEMSIRSKLDNHIIIKPSVVYGEKDNFINMFGSMAKYFGRLPVIKKGKTKFQPIFVEDLVGGIINLIYDFNSYKGKTITAVGNTVYTFKEILILIFNSIGKKPKFIHLPNFVASLQGLVLQNLPNPIFTYDQYITLDYDSIDNKKNNTFRSLLKRDLSDFDIQLGKILNKFKSYT